MKKIKTIQSILAICTILSSFLIGISQKQHLANGVYDATAYAAAISVLVFGDTWRSGYRQGVIQMLSEKGVTNENLRSIVENGVIDTRVVEPVRGNDVGYEEFVLAASWLFGLRIDSKYHLYFIILALSCGAYIAAYRHSVARLFELQAVLTGIALFTYAIPTTTQLASLAEARTIGILSLPAALHWLNFALGRGGGMGWRASALLAAQALVIVIAVMCRMTVVWQILMIVAVVAVQILSESGRARLRFNGPAVIGLVGLLFVARELPATFNDGTAGAANQGHIFWHNLGVGFSLGPEFQARYGGSKLELTDDFMFLLVEKKAVTEGTVDQIYDTHVNGRHYLTNWRAANRSAYEQAAKEIVFGFLEDHPIASARLFLLDKPLVMLRVLAIYTLPWTFDVMDRLHAWIPFDLFKKPDRWTFRHIRAPGDRVHSGYVMFIPRIVFLIPVLIAVFIVPGLVRRRVLKESIVTLMCLGVGSAIPSIGIYPEPHTMGPFLVIVAAGVFPAVAAAMWCWGPRQIRGLPSGSIASVDDAESALSARGAATAYAFVALMLGFVILQGLFPVTGFLLF